MLPNLYGWSVVLGLPGSLLHLLSQWLFASGHLGLPEVAGNICAEGAGSAVQLCVSSLLFSSSFSLPENCTEFAKPCQLVDAVYLLAVSRLLPLS